jgi:hypothetical protein
LPLRLLVPGAIGASIAVGQAAPAPQGQGLPAAPASPAAADLEAEDEGGPRLADAPLIETQTLNRMLREGAWPRRALAAMRLERYECAESRRLLETLREDTAWQVRAFSVRTMGRRRIRVPDGAFAAEEQPRVLRAALRHRYPVDTERLGRAVRYLARSRSLQDKMLAVELGIASGDEALAELATETARTIILRMGRLDAGSLSPRLSALTGQPDMRRRYHWHRWLRKIGRRFEIQPAHGVPASPDAPIEPGRLASIDPAQFAALESYIEDLSRRSVDLAICLDCTASMSAQLAEAQGGIDDLMVFVGDVADTLRVALVAYRDRRDEFETKAWDFTADVGEARRRLWSLAAAGGGDRPEAVYPALHLAYGRLDWLPGSTRVLVLVGDGPPRVGYGGLCVEMAKRAALAEVTTHVIEADERSVKHFAEIARAGGGRCVPLGAADRDSLIVEIAGLTLGERFEDELREFFRTYLELCR